jgi:hypothetical protein
MAPKTPQELLKNFRDRFDQGVTDYLRSTTTDQELLDFYGEGNVIGRKGIPATPGGVINQTFDAIRDLPGERPIINRPKIESDDLFSLPGEELRMIDMEGAVDPSSKRPYQLQFETLPFPAEAQPTAAAQRFLKDFRVPLGQAVDYGFEITPNTKDVKEREISAEMRDVGNFINSKEAQTQIDAGQQPTGPLTKGGLQRIEDIKQRARVPRPDGILATPSYYQSQGYELPAGLKDTTLSTFKQAILDEEQPFGSVSQLTPVEESKVKPGGSRYWRANLYEKAGLAGPQTPVTLRGAYGDESSLVQQFVRGSDRLLPIQPYTEFLDDFDASPESALKTEPAPDFTPFQKRIGTRNYLLGRNLLQGRGAFGRGLRGATSIGAVDLIPSREAVRDFYRGDYVGGAKRVAGEFVEGMPVALATGLGLAALPAKYAAIANPVGAGVAGGFALTRGAEALDEATKQQTGEGLLDKFQQTVGTLAGPGFGRPSTGAAYRGSERADERLERLRREAFNPATPPVAQLGQGTRETPAVPQNELQRRFRMAQQRFNPSRGEFGFTELLGGK